MVERNPAGRLMGGVWAFPGGGVEPAMAPARAACASRRFASSRRRPRSRGSTPMSSCRSGAGSLRSACRCASTRTSSSRAPPTAGARRGRRRVHRRRLVHRRRRARARGRLPLLFPTRKQLERLHAFEAIEELLDAAAPTGRDDTPAAALPGDRASRCCPAIRAMRRRPAERGDALRAVRRTGRRGRSGRRRHPYHDFADYAASPRSSGSQRLPHRAPLHRPGQASSPLTLLAHLAARDEDAAARARRSRCCPGMSR